MTAHKTDLSNIPAPLRASVRQSLDRLAENPVVWQAIERDQRLADSLPQVLACSEYVADVLARFPEQMDALVEQDRMHRPLTNGELQGLARQAIDTEAAETEFLQHLRLFRHRELLRIAWRDLCAWADLGETLNELSGLADVAICASLEWSKRRLELRYGEPRAVDESASEFVVLGMGKLGGGELNFSSDVDLVFLYSKQGQTAGRQA